jgi:hypothetical protein
LVSIFIVPKIIAAYELQYADEPHNKPFVWKSNVITISISSSLMKLNPSIRPDSDVAGAITRSLETWENAANVRFIEISSDRNSVSPPGKRGDTVSLVTVAQTTDNLLLFGGDFSDLAARTRVFFNRKGFITEADIVLNPYKQFSTDGSIGTFDLQATLTHEIGHLLGLGHSFVIGATMQVNQGMNGVYGLPGYSARSLSEDDIAGIRAIYGPKSQSNDCCGSVVGKLSSTQSKSSTRVEVWLENLEDGRVIAGVSPDDGGNFRFDGISVGEYIVYAKNNSYHAYNTYYAIANLGLIEVSRNKTVEITADFGETTSDFKVQYLGFNGQLSEVPVPVNGGKSYIIYIGGKSLDPKNLSIEFNSPYIQMVPDSMISHQFGEGLSAVSFEVKLGNKIPNGDYSIIVSNLAGKTDILAGCLTVSNVENNFATFTDSAEN